jgi:prepilin-type processing-associated H-X9-DG protein
MGANRGWTGSGLSLENSIAEQLQGIKDGTLWPYTKNEKLYACPTGRRGDLSTYSIFDGMNGFYLWRGSGIAGKPGVWIKKKSEISNPSPSLRMVFIDEGYVGKDSFAVNYSSGGSCAPETWFDSPASRHGGGGCYSFADGHSDYRKWKGQWTLEFAKACEYVETNAQTACKRPGDPIPLTPEIPGGPTKSVTAAKDDFEDLYYIQRGCWGSLGYLPTGPS